MIDLTYVFAFVVGFIAGMFATLPFVFTVSRHLASMTDNLLLALQKIEELEQAKERREEVIQRNQQRTMWGD